MESYPLEEFTLSVSKLTFKSDTQRRRLFTEVHLDLTRSSKYATEDVSGFSNIVHTDEGPTISRGRYFTATPSGILY